MMRVRFLLVSAILGLSFASVALAAPPAGKGKPGAVTTSAATTTTSAPVCRPTVSVIVQGTLANAPGATPTLPFALQVRLTQANAHGKVYLKASQPVTVMVDAKTVIRRDGAKQLSALLVGDKALVQARVCKSSLANGASPQLTAVRITAHPAS